MANELSALKGQCLLCEKTPPGGLHLKAAKLIQKSFIFYELCECCSLESEGYDPSKKMPIREKVWERVEKKLKFWKLDQTT